MARVVVRAGLRLGRRDTEGFTAEIAEEMIGLRDCVLARVVVRAGLWFGGRDSEEFIAEGAEARFGRRDTEDFTAEIAEGAEETIGRDCGLVILGAVL